MNDLSKSIFYKRHEDDEVYDRITIEIVPRYKTSGLSGNEWRISVLVKLYRKGSLIAERSWNKLQWALACLPAWIAEVGDQGFGGKEFNHKADEQKCAQPGCSEPGSIEYRLKGQYCQVAPHDGPHQPKFDLRRRFCQRHAIRGDAGFEDSDQNYEQLSGPSPRPEVFDESPSSRVSVNIQSLDDVPNAVQQVRETRKPR